LAATCFRLSPENNYVVIPAKAETRREIFALFR
jgi:hypothetical protein